MSSADDVADCGPCEAPRGPIDAPPSEHDERAPLGRLVVEAASCCDAVTLRARLRFVWRVGLTCCYGCACDAEAENVLGGRRPL